MATMGEIWTQVGSVMASVMFVYAMFQQYFPDDVWQFLKRYSNRAVCFFYPYIQITFPEYTGDVFKRSEVYAAIQNYLGAMSATRAKRLKAHDFKDSKSLVLSMDYNEEVIDVFEGVKIWWTFYYTMSNKTSVSYNPNSDEKRFYKLTFHRSHKDLITTSYINHVVEKGKELAVKNRQRKLYTNGKYESWYGTKWSHVLFEHPARFDTLALDPKKKQEIINDLVKFKQGKEYYARIGKPWKRGYLLYGPPGTGKSTMISAMANFLDYDLYDLELTAVKDNTELRKLLIDTSNKSIIVIEDIDCSLGLTGQRKKAKAKAKAKAKEKENDSDDSDDSDDEEDSKKSNVTLSGLLNFIDGIWSSCGGERLIVFTTNHVDKLDPALIRRGRMDKHIELSYCCFEAFKVLAKNYLDVESHDLFATIQRLLGEINMTPADVAENLIPKSDDEDADVCLENLVEALEEKKKKKKNKSEGEEKEGVKVSEQISANEDVKKDDSDTQYNL